MECSSLTPMCVCLSVFVCGTVTLKQMNRFECGFLYLKAGSRLGPEQTEKLNNLVFYLENINASLRKSEIEN